MKKKLKITSLKKLPKTKDADIKETPFYKLFKLSSPCDKVCILLGSLLSAFAGTLTPLMFLNLGDLTTGLIKFHNIMTSDRVNDTVIMEIANEDLMSSVFNFMIYNFILGFLLIISAYISVLLICTAANKQISKLQSLYMESVLNKDISWYDTNQTGDFSSRIIEYIGKLEEAIGDKFATFVLYLGLIISAVIIGLVKGWKLALICLVYLPLSLIIMAILSWVNKKFVQGEMEAYATASSIAEEVLSAFRTVIAFDGQNKEITRYEDSLKVAKVNNIKKGLFVSIHNAFMWFFIFASYGLSLYYGLQFVIEERNIPVEERVYTPGNMLSVYLNSLIATWHLNQCGTLFQIFSSAQIAASRIFGIIAEKPKINLAQNKGHKAKHFQGNVRFNNVHFQYPSRPEIKILQGLTLDIRKGETVALVGSSGCGKSTCIQLIQRFYDPSIGEVSIDGINLKEYDLKWLRSKIGVVGQEPVLFSTTIEENIRYGNPNASLEDVEAAAKKANAHVFIEKLPNGYKTLVGERGAQLSGGQKQRIAIARALIRNPTILLLDEATSALDTHSEALVQEALDNASKECTTIIVAHRLSTIRGADRIIVLNEGKVIEDGNHTRLMDLQGAYYKLVTSQISEKGNDDSQCDEKVQSDEEDNHNSFISQGRQSSVKQDTIKQETETSVEKTFGSAKVMWKILKINKPEWLLIAIGCLGTILQGACAPMYALIYSAIIGALAIPDDDNLEQEGNKYSLYFCYIGIICGIASFIQTYLFSISGETLTVRVRTKMFGALLKQEAGWYDVPEHGVGALSAKLSVDGSGIQGAAGQTIGTILYGFSNLGFAILIAFCVEWRLSLVTLCFVPFTFLAIYFGRSAINKRNNGSKDSIELSAKYAIEAINNIRTVTSLGLEDVFHAKYLELLDSHYQAAKRKVHFRGLILGTGRSLTFFCYGCAMYYGGTLIRDEHIHYQIVFRVYQCLIIGATAMGNALAFAPNFQKGIESARRVIALLERQPKITDGNNSMQLPSENAHIHFEKIKFAYPTRPNNKILNGLNLKVLQGKTVALVGPSGCGKSTIVQLLERFYDPLSGFISIASNNIQYLELSNLRSKLGIVSQGPNLFDRTIRENIAYGDNSREVNPEEVISAAKKANIHSFITALPLGYETRLGEKGTQLSGGQKQRIAIARALIRDPQILLLDEATSALDTESEKIVQEALDKAKAGRTCITIAHRLVTTQDADVICVIDKGVVSEIGNHQELLSKRGTYFKLYHMQMGRH